MKRSFTPAAPLRVTALIRVLTNHVGLILLLLTLQPAIAQKTRDIFSPDISLTFLGVDFSEARLIGDPVIKAADLPKQFVGINNQLINESKKYDLSATFHRSTVATDISAVLKKTARIDPATIKSDNPKDLTRVRKDQLNKIISSYDYGKRKGIGVMFIVIGMSNAAKTATMYITFFDIASKKILLTELLSGEPGGFGFRNYWLTAVGSVMKQIEKTKFNEWKVANK